MSFRQQIKSIPPWVWGISVAIAHIDPVMHVVIERCPPEGAAPTGLHTLDAAAYLCAMHHAHGEFFSPYEACFVPPEAQGLSNYAIAFHHVYGLFGRIARLMDVSSFHALGIANGCGVLFLLLSAYLLVRKAAPRLAGTAFLIHALAGGLGGPLYLLASAMGWNHSPEFPLRFMRYFVLELSEGPRFQPYLMLTRMYYTVPLGLGYLMLCTLLRPTRGALGTLLPCVLLLLAGILNFRLAPMFWGIAIAYLYCAREQHLGSRIRAAGLLTTAAAASLVFSVWLLSLNPETPASMAQNSRMLLWLSPFLSATCLLWPLALPPLLRAINQLPPPLRAAGCAALGYLGLYALLYAGYQAYYGNFWRCLDVMVAVHMCDWALLGAPIGLLYAWRVPSRDPADGTPPWMALWFLGAFALSISAFGQGWFLKFTPDRFAVVLGLPFSMLAAQGLASLRLRAPRLALGWLALLLGCGIATILVTWTVSYGPLGYRTLQTSFPWTRCAFMNRADATLLDRIHGGVTLTPSMGSPLFGDVLALRPGHKVVYGNATLGNSHQIMPEVRAAVSAFYAPGTPDAERQAFAEKWCVDFVYCPDTDPVPPETIAELRATPWLEEIASEANAVLFRTRP